MAHTPEQQLIAACLSNSDLIRTASEYTTGVEFQDHRLELAWDLMVKAKAERSPLDLTTFHLAVTDAGVRGIEATDAWQWHEQVWSVSELTVQRLAESIHDDYMQREIVRIVTENRPGEAPVGDALSRMIEGLSGIRKHSSGSLLDGKDLGELLEVSGDYDWLVEGLMERGDRLMLTGGEGAGKTTFARQMAVCLSAGIHPFKLTEINPLRCLVIDAENSERQWKRAASDLVSAVLHGRPPADPRTNMHIVCSARLDVTREAHIGAVHRKIDEFNPDIVFIGPLYKITSGAITNDDDAAPLLAALDSIRDRGLAMVIEAHAGKSANAAGDRNLAPRGSSALLGWPEFGVGLRLDENNTDGWTRVVELSRWRGDRDVRDWPMKLTSAGPLAWNDDDADPNMRRRFYQ